jgi:hypothetical protein
VQLGLQKIFFVGLLSNFCLLVAIMPQVRKVKLHETCHVVSITLLLIDCFTLSLNFVFRTAHLLEILQTLINLHKQVWDHSFVADA